jgi:dolichyl-phosphate-mannose-protein mannosyltransferase
MWRKCTARQASNAAPGFLHRVPESAERLIDSAAGGVLLVVAVIAALTFRDYGLGWDDYTHAQYGQLLLDYYASGLSDRRALSFVNLYMYGGGFDMAAALLDKILPFALFETRRLLGAAVGLIGLFVAWRIARRMGGPLAGLLGLILLATCPLYYGHMFMNSKDAPFAVAMTILLLGLVRAVEEYPRPRIATIAIFAMGLGLSIGSRILGGIAVLYMILPMALLIASDLRSEGVRHAGSNFSRFLLTLLPGLILAYAIMAILWPWSVIAPLNPIRAIGYFSGFFENPWKEMFGGSLIEVPDMPRIYVPVLFSLKLPEILLALSLGGIAAALANAARSQLSLRRRATLILVATAAILPIIIAIVTRPAMYNGIRHFVFVTPPLAVLGGLAGAWLIEQASRLPKATTAAAGIVLLVGLIVPIVEMVRLHPYQYAHFNQLAGGIRAADERYMLDYWGLAFKQAGQELRAKLTERLEVPARRRWRIAVCGPHPAAQVELGPEFLPTWDPKDADFALMLGEFYCAELKAPVLVEIEREGVVFARVYDIRGHNVTSLFTIPPLQRD